MALGQGHLRPLGNGQQLCELLSRSNVTVINYGPAWIFVMCALWPWRYDLGSRSWHTLGSWITIVWMTIKIQLDSKEFGPDKSLGMYVLWPWPWRYDLGSRSWHTLGSLITLWNIIQIQLGSEELWAQTGILGMCTLWPLSWRYNLGSRLWHILASWTTLSRSNFAVRSYSTDRFWVCVHSDWMIQPLVLMSDQTSLQDQRLDHSV